MTTVLIVDDHPAFRAAARALLESEGFDVIAEAEDAKSALLVAGDLEPDVVLLDVQLPDTNGFEVARRLTKVGSPPTVILVSSRDRGDYGHEVDRAPARGFIGKAELSGARLAVLLDAT